MSDVKAVDKASFWLGNTCLHVATKSQQLEVVNLLVNTYKAETEIKNRSGKTALSLAQTLKDKNITTTLSGLLNKIHTSTKVVRNGEIKLER